MLGWINDIERIEWLHGKDVRRMGRLVRELAKYAGNFAIEMGGMHIFEDTYPDASDDAKEIIKHEQRN